MANLEIFGLNHNDAVGNEAGASEHRRCSIIQPSGCRACEATLGYLELLAVEWKMPKPMSYRVELRKPAGPAMVTFSFSERPFVDGLREALYQDEIWERPILHSQMTEASFDSRPAPVIF